ncbi:MAG TPA: hypothetical protein EYQ61_02255 [Dehalococcoidia bacterium]|nr:hypothetical protein [Dehalococcoidia bacterium]
MRRNFSEVKDRVLLHEKLADPNGQTIPLIVRMKLDLVGVRIHLADWRALDKSYCEFLIAMIPEWPLFGCFIRQHESHQNSFRSRGHLQIMAETAGNFGRPFAQ